jgi:hypothetical protein
MLALRPMLNELYRAISKQESAHSEAALLVAGELRKTEIHFT